MDDEEKGTRVPFSRGDDNTTARGWTDKEQKVVCLFVFVHAMATVDSTVDNIERHIEINGNNRIGVRACVISYLRAAKIDIDIGFLSIFYFPVASFYTHTHTHTHTHRMYIIYTVICIMDSRRINNIVKQLVKGREAKCISSRDHLEC